MKIRDGAVLLLAQGEDLVLPTPLELRAEAADLVGALLGVGAGGGCGHPEYRPDPLEGI